PFPFHLSPLSVKITKPMIRANTPRPINTISSGLMAVPSLTGSDTNRFSQPRGFALFVLQASCRDFVIVRERHPQVLGPSFGKEPFIGRDCRERIGVVSGVPGQAQVGGGGHDVSQMNETGSAALHDHTL